MFPLLLELIKKDLLVFFSDRKAVLIAFLVPICIASFIGSIMGNISGGGTPDAVQVLVVNEDDSPVTKQIVDRLKASKTVSVTVTNKADAAERVRSGDVGNAIVFPKGFGEQAVAAMTGGKKPSVQLLTDPSKGIETKVAEGALMGEAVPPIVNKVYPGSGDSVMPFQVSEKAQTKAEKAIPWSGSAHAFAGLAVQALLFGAVETGMRIIQDRRNGIWSRLRASPVSRWTVLSAKLIGSAIIALFVFFGVVAAGAVIFHYRITGSYLGFLMVAIGTASVAAGIGLFIAALGRTEQQSRGLSILVILVMLMLGGAWMPMFLFPHWVQQASLISPVRWAVDGIDFMTWRGGTLADAARCMAVLMLFAAGLTLLAGRRFQWTTDGA